MTATDNPTGAGPASLDEQIKAISYAIKTARRKAEHRTREGKAEWAAEELAAVEGLEAAARTLRRYKVLRDTLREMLAEESQP